ncbi:hypothetical protein GGR55DRAFT_679687 [Xylaria sp. FL0064]|nr:hypothetical protein GGR55DRAFT_679687 [Xylaria sp. FL0064]
MKDALHLKLPSWPPRVHFPRRSQQAAAKNEYDGKSSSSSNSASSTDDTDPEANKTPEMFGSEPSYHRLQSPQAPVSRLSRFKQRRVRWLLSGVLVFGIITIILLSTLLTRHTVGGLDTLFKACAELIFFAFSSISFLLRALASANALRFIASQ